MDSFLYDLLIDPLTGEQLFYNESSKNLSGEFTGLSYKLIGSVPVIILNNTSLKTDLHLKYNSELNYADHYQIDSVLFDYSEKQLPVIVQNEFSRLRESILREISDDHLLILDVGCGNGWVARRLIPSGKKVISMDISSVNPLNVLQNIPH